jgi:hypothetical protein
MQVTACTSFSIATSSEGMSAHHAATTGAIGKSALRLKAAYAQRIP